VIGFFDSQGGLDLPFPWANPNTNSLQSSAILIIGGGTNCGRYATQLAALVGFGTIVVVGGNESELKRFGATHVINRHGGHDKLLEDIRDVVGDELIYAFDTINNPPEQHLAINALSSSKKGKLARLTYSRGDLKQDLIHAKESGYELKNVVGISALKADIAGPFWMRLEEYLKQGKLRPLEMYVVKKGLDAGSVNVALDKWRDGKGGVQTHVRISE
jgi:NADPH2:quinone reductase